MKAFEEYCVEPKCVYDSNCTNIGCRVNAASIKMQNKQMLSHGWRASLKWLYDQLGYSEEHEELKDLIEKELRDG